MNRSLQRQVVWFAVIPSFVILAAGPAIAQRVEYMAHGITPGIPGEVFLDGQPLPLAHESARMQNGQRLQTEAGLVEIVLAPGVYIRMGERATLWAGQNSSTRAEWTLEKGSALVEVVRQVGRNPIRLRLSTGIVEIADAGLYRLDSDFAEIRVYGGKLRLTNGNKELKVKSGEMVSLRQGIVASGFDATRQDKLHRWSAGRSFDLFIADPDNGRQKHWKLTPQGSLVNSRYGMQFYSEQYILNRQKESAEANRGPFDLSETMDLDLQQARRRIEAEQEQERRDQWNSREQERLRIEAEERARQTNTPLQ